MSEQLTVITEQVDDFPLLLGTMLRLGLPRIIDKHLIRHGLQKGLSWGWIASIWLAHMLSQSDHRKQPVQAWVRQAQKTIEIITGQKVDEFDFTDDKLTVLLRRLSKPATWEAVQKELGQNIIRVYELQPQTVRCDMTTVSGYHQGDENGLFQYGHSKDDPTLQQVKVMMATLDPLGLPLVSQVVPGNTADDVLYIPAVDQVLKIIDGIGLLFVGDSKMSALAIRAHIQQVKQHYLCPLAKTGKVGTDFIGWVETANSGKQPLQSVYIEDKNGDPKLLAEGYVFERTVRAEVLGKPQADGTQKMDAIEWAEQVFVVRSERYRASALENLKKHLEAATAELLALTPPRGRGKRQILEESALVNAATVILKNHDVEGLLCYSFERQEKSTTKNKGRGRNGPDRAKQTITTVRYQITGIIRQEDAIDAHKKTLGWRVYVSDAPSEQLSLEQAVLTYRDEWIIEHGFHRLKGAPLSLDPLFLKNDDQIKGLTNLLSIAVRMLTLIEFVVRRKLKQNQEKLTGLIENNPKKGIDNPTTERLLRTFRGIYLSTVHLPNQEPVRHITRLSNLQIRILELLGLSPTIYSQLADN
jgi:transposase